MSRHEPRILALLLTLLHFAIWGDLGGGLSRSMMLAHLGVFLLWQPLLRADRRLAWRGIAAFAIITIAFLAALSWTLVAFWLLLLIGLVGGRVDVAPRQRYAYLIVLLFLALELLIGCVPPMFALDTPAHGALAAFRYGLLLLPATLLFIPGESANTRTLRPLDLLHSLTVSLLAVILALGALTSTLATQVDYLVALLQTVTGIALFLLAVAWLWAPMAGFSGLGHVWERYVQNVGTPFEFWLSELERNARSAQSPERFLDAALAQLAGLPWVSGLEWASEAGSGTLGARSGHAFRSRSGDLLITLFAYRHMGTTLSLHARLLVQLVAHFYRAKQRESEMARQAHLHAIYETGARVTHDIKNLLQSLKAMTSAVKDGRDPEAATALLQRQLPHVTRRLQLALDKLQAPREELGSRLALSAWWRGLVERNAGQGILFAAELGDDPAIPSDLFDSVAENLIENARLKRQREPGIRISVQVHANEDGVRLRVSDDGSAVDDATASRLFHSAVASESGLGIGLYQAARQAAEHGYRLTLSQGRQRVSFELRPASAARAARAG